MSLCREINLRRAALLIMVMAMVLTTAAAFGQAADEGYPKFDVFLGYQWLNPGNNVPGNVQFNGPIGTHLDSLPKGAGAAVAFNFTRFFALEGDFGYNFNDNVSVLTGSGGVRLMKRTEAANFFIHGLVGLNQLEVTRLGTDNNLGVIAGGGMDLLMWKHLSLRLFEADYVYTNHDFAGISSQRFDGLRLRTGAVLNFGFPPEAAPTASCSVQPTEVMVGEPVTATITTTNFNPKHTLNYAWTTTGGKVTGNNTSASIDTNGVAGGSYTVTAHANDPKRKKGGDAMCTASFTVKEPPKNPPTMSCSANPTDVKPGETSTITCTCTSPDNVSTQVSNWTASAGNVTGSGNTATLTAGNDAGAVTVNATCTDARGLTGQGSATVNVTAPPPPPPAPEARKVSTCDFPNARKPWRVDNTCKAILDDVAQNLQQSSDAKLVIVGTADPSEKRKNLAAERAVDAKAYLTGGEAKQNIDPSRIETRTSSEPGKSAEFWIVPAGATFPEANTTTVDESKVKAVPDHPGRKPMKKKAMAAPSGQ